MVPTEATVNVPVPTFSSSVIFSACTAKGMGAQPGPTSRITVTKNMMTMVDGPRAAAPMKPQMIAPGKTSVPM
jgi:hypothetical protein